MSKERHLRHWEKYIATFGFVCISWCNQCCHDTVPMSKYELQRIGDAKTYQYKGKCRFWSNGCTIYDVRPMMCRLFGLVDSFPGLICPYSKPSMYIPDGKELLVKYMEKFMGAKAVSTLVLNSEWKKS